MLVRLSRLRFGARTADALALLLEPINDPESLAQIGEWIIQCASGETFLAQVRERLVVDRHAGARPSPSIPQPLRSSRRGQED